MGKKENEWGGGGLGSEKGRSLLIWGALNGKRAESQVNLLNESFIGEVKKN